MEIHQGSIVTDTPEGADICHAYLIPFLPRHIMNAFYQDILHYATQEAQ